MFNGTLVFADSYYGEWMTKLISSLGGYHEPQEEICFQKILPFLDNSASMIEVGCYWGYYSASFLRAVRKGRAVLCEPVPTNLATAISTLAINGVRGDYRLCGIGKLPDEMKRVAVGASTRGNCNIPIMTIPEIADLHSLGFIDLLHSDVQGAEMIMLEESEELFAKKRIGYAFISTHSQDLHRECLQLLRSYKYTILFDHNMRESYSYDGLIVVASPDSKMQDEIVLPKRSPDEWKHNELTLNKEIERLKSQRNQRLANTFKYVLKKPFRLFS
jgi:FkbM family methyltransferase